MWLNIELYCGTFYLKEQNKNFFGYKLNLKEFSIFPLNNTALVQIRHLKNVYICKANEKESQFWETIVFMCHSHRKEFEPNLYLYLYNFNLQISK